MRRTSSNRQPWNFWSPAGRALVFVLATTSIGCLLAEFYRLCPMRTFTLFIFLPALIALAALSVADRLWGNCRLWRGILIGVASGLVAAMAYDVFRLPFVFSQTWGIDSTIPPLNLFKVFPAFGAMILGEPAPQPRYALAAHLTGWAYHLSNAITFGVMFVAALGEVARNRIWWAVAMAVGLELGMLFTPYPNVFGIPVTPTFVAVTLTAHLVFGVALGRSARWMAMRWRTPMIRPL